MSFQGSVSFSNPMLPAFAARDSKDSPGTKPKALFLGSNRRLTDFIASSLQGIADVATFTDSDAFLLETRRPDLVIFDWDTLQNPLSILKAERKVNPGVPLLLLCGSANADEYRIFASVGTSALLEKPFTADKLHQAVGKLLPCADHTGGFREVVLDETHSFVCLSKSMLEVERQAALVAPSNIPVLILGESGTGKEILAMYIHKMSSRKDRIFLKINCAAMPAELLESELFGYEKGAFTGAVTAKPGRFEVCDGGTIFLDEIGEMPVSLQAKLLQVLQDGTYSRLGSRSARRTDVRVVSATNIPMKEAIANGTFREDVYYRLNGISIKLPPLRERMDELQILIRHFMKKGSERFALEPLPISTTLMAALQGYHWPGNIRELENIINRLLVLRQESGVMEELRSEDLSASGSPASNGLGLKDMMDNVREETESAAIFRVLEEKRWNRRAAADELQISYKSLLSKMKQYGIAPRSN